MIYTFYSYKGGVGRTMALANVAELLYNKGLRILMVDWDLEAPGLEKFFNSENTIGNMGLLDLLQDYKQKMSTEFISDNLEDNDDIEGPIMDSHKSGVLKWGSLPFLKPADLVFDIYPESESNGKLYLLTAGKRDAQDFERYAKMVVNFDWHDFYKNWAGEHYIEWLRSQFERLADIVLIDSRTGIAEMTGVCTYQLADVIVMFCAPNMQSISGTYEMLCNFKRPEVGELRRNRPLEVLVIPSRVDEKAELFIDEFHDIFLDKFKDFMPKKLNADQGYLWELKIPYIPAYSFKELVAVREREKPHADALVHSFTKLSNALVQLSAYPELFKIDPLEAYSKSLARILIHLPRETISTLIRLLIESDLQYIKFYEHNLYNSEDLLLFESNGLLDLDDDGLVLKPIILRMRDPSILRRTIFLLGGYKKLDKQIENLCKNYVSKMLIPKDDLKNLFGIQKDIESLVLLKPANTEKMERELIKGIESMGIKFNSDSIEKERTFEEDVPEKMNQCISIYKNIKDKKLFNLGLEKVKKNFYLFPELREFHLSVIQYGILQSLFLRRFKDAKSLLKYYLRNGGDKLWARLRIALIFQIEGHNEKTRRILIKTLEKSIIINDKKTIALSLYYLGIQDRIIGNLESSVKNYNDSLKILDEIDDKYHLGVVLASRGVANRLLDNIDEAMDDYKLAYEIFSVLEEDFRMACVMGRLATAYRMKKQYSIAIDHYEKSLTIFKHFSDFAHEANILKELGTTYVIIGQKDRAENSFIEALQCIKSLEDFTYHDRFREAEVKYNLGVTYLAKNQTTKAKEELEEALTSFVSLGDKYYECIALMSLGVANQILKYYKASIECFNEALTGFMDIGENSKEGWLWERIGKLSYTYIYDYDKAIKSFDYALKAYSKQPSISQENQGRIHGELGIVYRKMGLIERATQELEAALKIFQNQKDSYNTSWILEELGQVYVSQDQFQKAIEKYKESKNLFDKDKEKYKGESIDKFIGLLSIEGKFKQAAEKYQEALFLYQKIDNLSLEGKILRNLCHAFLHMRDLDNARKYAKEALKIYREIDDFENLGKILLYMGQIYKLSGNNAQAIRKIKASIKIFNKIIKNRYLENMSNEILGNIFLEQSNWIEAEKIFSRVIESDERSSSASLSLALCYKNMPDKKDKYVFCWTKIPGTDDKMLKEFLEKNYHIDWVYTAGISKSEDGKTINMSKENKTLSLTLISKESEVILKINNTETDKFTAKKENGELNIYKDKYIKYCDKATNLLDKDHVSDYDLACLESVKGNFDISLKYIENALKKDGACRVLVQSDPHLMDLRDNPRFIQLIIENIPRDQIEIVPWA